MEVWHEPYSMCNMNRMIEAEFLSDDPKMTPIKTLIKRELSLEITLEEKIQMSKSVDQSCFRYSWVRQQLEEPRPTKKFVFVKDVSTALYHGNFDELLPRVGFRHTFLIRHPIPTLLAWKRLMMRAVLELPLDTPQSDVDIISDVPCFTTLHFYEELYNLWNYAKRKGDEKPLVIDSDDLIRDPEVILSKYCKALGLPWDKKYLNWASAIHPRQAWRGSYQVLKGFDFRNAFESATFDVNLPTKREDFETLTPDLQKCVRKALPFYEEMYKSRIMLD
ncbi:hypothetical protein HOLleu_41291 [Holothuria leucospilota]|uniref:Uncharacterized protein n=1 Tax=Holothuria leucospilota TaxID=206669 RepID=A0A9Q0YBN9_HOLLE|nr:hypothetical protein HOLleu_41291 [Holothuria leucospilota]